MAIPALPIPTGGVTHIFEAAVMLLCLELIIGRKTIWLPKKILHRPLGKTLEKKGLPYLIRKVRWLEKHSRTRGGRLLSHPYYLRLVGATVLVFTIVAFFSVPFSGMDTLPSMGVVGIALGLILEDVVLYVVGVILGSIGVGLYVALGAAATEAVKRLL
jgi:hypothetical protein